MKTKRLTLIPLSVLALGVLAGCNKTSQKLVKAADATLAKVSEFNNVLSKYNDGKNITTNSESDWKYLDTKGDIKDYCDNQVFGFYIYDNIYYAMKYLYGNNSVNLGTVITGKTKNKIPDVELGKYLKDKETVLSSVVNATSKDNKTTIEFKADWDFRIEGTSEQTLYDGYSAILTNGRVIYNEKLTKPKS